MSARLIRFFALVWLALALVAPALRAAISLPPSPAAHFNDYAGFVSPDRARALDARLAQFERDSSNQLVVAIFPRLPSGAALEDYTVRTAQAWGVGQKKKDNGAVLFVFVADHALRIEVGYGLEGSLTDALAHAIIENELKPRLRAGQPADALDAAVNAMIAATKGEYRGTGRTMAEQRGSPQPARGTDSTGDPSWVIVLFWAVMIIVIVVSQIRRGYVYRNPSRRRPLDDFWDSNSSSGGSWGGGSSGGGGFSGGGGSFGGGGASGKW